jgi:hypothetical protein
MDNASRWWRDVNLRAWYDRCGEDAAAATLEVGEDTKGFPGCFGHL